MARCSTRKTRELACRLAAQVCSGHLPEGTILLSYVIFFENYIDCGPNKTGELMGWDVKEKPPINLQIVRAEMTKGSIG